MTAYKIGNRITLLTAKSTDNDVTAESFQAKYCIYEELQHFPFANDFGTFNLASTYSFCSSLHDLLTQHPQGDVVVISLDDTRSLTNAVFLLGAFLIMLDDAELHQAEAALQNVLPNVEGYCDVSEGPPTFLLDVRDCWAGLWKAKALRWVSFIENDESHFDPDAYLHLDNPLNADMHVIVPGKLIAMRGPRDLGGTAFADSLALDGSFRCRDFSPAHMADILTQFDVSTVVRLNESCYDSSSFREHGIAVAELFFPDCTLPSALLVAKFLAIAESVPGALAVHCKAGLGRTGTLIALYMMKHHGFSARAAMGWLRIVRPGSVIGDQQAFLVDREEAIARNRHHSLALGKTGRAEEGGGGGAAEVQARVDKVCGGMDQRFRGLAAATTAGGVPSRGRSPQCPAPANAAHAGASPPAQRELAAHVEQAAARRALARVCGSG